MKRLFFTCMMVAAAMLTATQATAQTVSRKWQAAEQNSIVSLGSPQVYNPLSLQQESFGDRLVNRLKASGRPLPAAEEKLRRLKPAHRGSVRPAETGEKPLTFTGFLQYNTLPNGMMALEYGFYKFSSKNGFVREEMAPLDWCLNGRGAYYNHRLHGTSSIPVPYYGSQNWVYCEWDADTWEPTGNHGARVGNEMIAKAADCDPTTGKCYAWVGGSTPCFQEMDYEHLGRTIILSTDTCVVAMAFDNSGQLYGLTENGYFCAIDKTNGRTTVISKIDFEFMQAFESMTCDRSTGKFYLIASEVDWDAEELMGRLCEVDPATGHTTLVAYLPENEEYTCLQVLHEPDADAPAALDDLFVNVVSEGVAGVVNFSIPTKTVAGDDYALTTHYVITVNDDDATAMEGDQEAGGFVARPLLNIPQGRLKVVVELSATDADGNTLRGERNVSVTWVGADTPTAADVTLSYDEATQQTTLSWKPAGLKGGSVPSGLTYDVVRYPDAVKVASQTTATTLTETLTNARYDGYYYEVLPYDGETAGVAARSNIIQFGAPWDIPYAESFDEVSVANRFTMIDGNGDGINWTVEPFQGNVLHHKFTKVSASDDWALTPPMHLLEGIAYQISFTARAVSRDYPETFSVACGMGTDPAAYQELIPATTITNGINQPQEFSGEVKIQQTGDYRFGFRCTSPVYTNALFIDDVRVTAGQLLSTPDSVKNLRLTAADDGDLVVTLDFDAPTVANDGTQLESITRIEITRGEKHEAVATLTSVEPGHHYTYVDEDAVNGHVLYSVTAYSDAGAGLTATATVYVGTDAPTVPLNVVLADNLDGTATLSWQAPLTGQNGGYVDADELTYNVYGVVNNQLARVQQDLTDMTYTVSGIPQTGPQGQTIYAVSAVNELGESGASLAQPLIYGAPYELPFMEGFLTSGLKGIWATRSGDAGTSWKMYSGMSTDGDDCVVGVESEHAGAWSVLTSGKISLAGAARPMLVFSVYGDPGTQNVLKVAIQKNGQAQADTVLTLNFAEQTEEDFLTCAIDLSAYRDANYITAAFVAQLNDPRLRMIVLDDVNVRNVDDYDVAAYPQMQHRTTAGQNARIGVTVHNVGQQEATGYEVSIYVNGEVVKTFTETEAVAPFGRAFFNYDYTTQATDPEQSTVWATVSYAQDQNTADNTTAQQALTIVPSQLEAVSALAATQADGKTMLTWTPVTEQNAVVESFEGYESFQKSFGQWGNYDQDRSQTAGINGLWWPGAGQPQAFLTFNFREAGVTEAQMKEHLEFEANSGSQFLACFKALNAPGNKNNDWLVSPELSGEEQTIAFYAQSLAGVWNETFEVFYSTTGNQVADFTTDNIIDEYEAPKNFSRFRINLPAGAKYFAIHCNSQNGGILMLDDISYVGRQLSLRGYNVYCDGQLVGTTGADATAYEHSTAALPTGMHVYHVTALYDEGESALSNAANVAVFNAIASAAAMRAQVAARQGAIGVSGARGLSVAVYTLAGQLVYRGMGDAVVPVAAGQYLVVVDGAVKNVVVR